MSLTLARMRYLVRKGLGGLTSSDLDDTDTDELLNMALWDLDGRYPFKEKECRVSATLTAGTDKYDLPSYTDAVMSVAVVDMDHPEKLHKLARMTHDWYDANAYEDSTDVRGQPERYLRRDDYLLFWPIPDDAYPIWVTLWRTVSSLLDGSVEATGLPRTWDEIVVQGAIERGHFYHEDYNLARQASDFQTDKIRTAVPIEAKEERDSRYAGLQVLWDFPSDT